MDEIILRKAAKWIWAKRDYSDYWNHSVLTRDNPDPTSPLIDKRIAFQVFTILEERKLMLPITVTKGNDIFSAYKINFNKEKEWKYLISEKRIFDLLFLRTIKPFFVKHRKLLANYLLFPLIVGAIIVFVFQPWQEKIQKDVREDVAESKKYKTLYDHFKNDFGLLKISNSAKLSKPNSDEVITIEYNLHMDPETNSKFISYYVPPLRDSSETYEVILTLTNFHSTIFKRIDSNVSVESKTPGDSSSIKSKDLKFSGIIYVYYAGILSLERLGEISKQYKNKGLIIQLRGQDYATIQNLSKEKKESQ